MLVPGSESVASAFFLHIPKKVSLPCVRLIVVRSCCQIGWRIKPCRPFLLLSFNFFPSKFSLLSLDISLGPFNKFIEMGRRPLYKGVVELLVPKPVLEGI